MGSAISNVCTYPLDLVITRLQIQKQLRRVSSEAGDDEYQGIEDAARRIYQNEGGISGFYTGLLQDTGKTIADAFLFFLAYTFLRQRRIAAKGSASSQAVTVLPILDELGIGFLAGSCTKLLTTPISNIVTRKQTSALVSSRSTNSAANPSGKSRIDAAKAPSTRQIAHDIMHEKGLLGFWSGYSASLILTLNPSLTFFLFETFKRLLLPRSKRENPPPSATFLMAAISKACASSVTYPFSVAKARAQVSARPVSSSDTLTPSVRGTGGSEDKANTPPTGASQRAVKSTIFSTLLSIVQSDGPEALYSGLPLELVKSFLSHGITMIVKQYVHRLIIHAYYILSLMVARLRSKGLKAGAQTEKLIDRAREQRVEYFDLARARAMEMVREAKGKAGLGGTMAGLGSDLVGKANETAELVADYVEEETEEWRSLYGTGLARWFEDK